MVKIAIANRYVFKGNFGNKILWVIAGANGSGKTSLVQHYSSRFKDQIPFIDPDDIAKEFDDKYDGKDTSLIQKAGREAIFRQVKYFKEGKSFGYETTFSSKRDLKIISQSQKDGYEIKLVFVGLETSANNITRVADRVQKGGHFVDGDIPITAIYSSASVHDSSLALHLTKETSQKVNYLYDLQDAAYDSSIIRAYCEKFNHRSIIDINPKNSKVRKEQIALAKSEKKILGSMGLYNDSDDLHYNQRSSVERVNAY